jgi:Cupin
MLLRLLFLFDRPEKGLAIAHSSGKLDRFTGRFRAMDILSDVLRAVRFTGVIFFERNNQAPWVGVSPNSVAIAGKVMPQAQHVISFHALVAGTCWAALVDGSEPDVHLNAGDIVILPMGEAMC